jgi:pimeloyl-ACP methyl ester carboxylesterase
MSLRLVCLHGFTQNGQQLAGQLAGIAARLPRDVELICPDAPHACAPASVSRLAAMFRMDPPPPPHCCWWDASDDGSEYRGWEVTREQLRTLCDRPGRVGLLGFSQGAIASTALAALHEHALFPRLDFAILIAGRRPRATVLAPLMAAPLRLPSLHVWGERDAGAAQACPALVETFDAQSRQVITWPGPHTVPERGPAADAIVSFIERFVG